MTASGFSPPHAAGLWALAVSRSWLEPAVQLFFRSGTARLEYARMSDQTTCRMTLKYKLQPTPAQERELERVVMLCRQFYNIAPDQRITAWHRCRVSLSRYNRTT